jgi:GTPase SAR1 family protein
MSKNKKEEDSIPNFKIAVCGGGGVGKSCITVQYVQHVYDHEEVSDLFCVWLTQEGL